MRKSKRTSVSVSLEEAERLDRLFPSVSTAKAIQALLDLVCEGEQVHQIIFDMMMERIETIDSVKRSKVFATKKIETQAQPEPEVCIEPPHPIQTKYEITEDMPEESKQAIREGRLPWQC